MSFNFVCFLLLLRVDVEDVGGLGEVHLGVVAEPNVYEVLVLRYDADPSDFVLELHPLLSLVLGQNVVKDLHFILGENIVQQFSDANDYDKHDGEEDLNGLELLDQPQDHEAEDLYSGEEMNPLDRNLSEVRVVWLVLLGHEEEQHPVEHLDPVEGADPHVQEHAVQHRHRDVP